MGYLGIPKFAALLGLGLTLVSAAACAQNQFDGAIPRDFPGRPTVSNPAYITAPGYLQFEQGAQITTDAPDLDTQLGFNQTTKISLTHRLMVQAAWQPLARSVTGGVSEMDQGDLALGMQFMLSRNYADSSYRPALAVGYQHTIWTGSAPDFDAKGNKDSILLLASGQLPHGLTYDANLAFNRQGNASGANRLQTGEAFALSGGITRRTSLSGEIWHFTQPFDRGHALGLLGAINFQARPNLTFDAGVSHGLTNTSAHWYGFFGCTYLLPHAFWHTNK